MTKNYITLDTETCGLAGMPVLLQWSKGDGPVQFADLWKMTPIEIIELLDEIINNPDGILGFNLVFDWFHICKLYTTCLLLTKRHVELEDQIEEVAEVEMLARDGPCIKPVTALDVMLHARKTHYQSTMDRKDVKIRRVPTSLAEPLARELEKRIPLKDIYFARKKDKNVPKWGVYDVLDRYGDIDPHFKNVVCKFAPSSALKALAADALDLDDDYIIKYGDVGVNPKLYPEELGYAPFAKAIGNSNNWKGAWPEVIKYHIDHWAFHPKAREYAGKDVDLTRKLYQYFGSPEFGDDDSILACMVAAVRWKGFSIDIPKIQELKKKVEESRYKMWGMERMKIPTAPRDVKRYIESEMTPLQIAVIEAASGATTLSSTKKITLENISKMTQDCECQKGCGFCKGSGKRLTNAAQRAREVLQARGAAKEIELYDKLICAGRFHVSNKIIGALSGRMSGADGLNAQGIKSTKDVRGAFPLAWPGTELDGGDYAAFEVTIAEACYGDLRLRKDLLTCENCDGEMEFILDKRDFICKSCGNNEGKAIHAIFGTYVYHPLTYKEVKATKGTPDDKYKKAKSAVFAMFFGGETYTLMTRLGVLLEAAEAAYQRFIGRYPGVGKSRQKIIDQFCSMKQPAGIGTQVYWKDPAEKIETLFGFARYFTLENQICKQLFFLANHVPPSWKQLKIKVQRREGRIQEVAGAVASALYGAAFNQQSHCMRAAQNHVIQGTGAQATKKVQVAIWEVQPPGVHPWRVQNFNVHDEIMAVCDPKYSNEIREKALNKVEEIRKVVPLVKLDWKIGMKNWAAK